MVKKITTNTQIVQTRHITVIYLQMAGRQFSTSNFKLKSLDINMHTIIVHGMPTITIALTSKLFFFFFYIYIDVHSSMRRVKYMTATVA